VEAFYQDATVEVRNLTVFHIDKYPICCWDSSVENLKIFLLCNQKVWFTGQVTGNSVSASGFTVKYNFFWIFTVELKKVPETEIIQ